MFRLAHLSDIHLPIDGPVHRRELFSKRMLGYANWTRSRHKIHRHEVLNAIVADLARQSADHVAVTGDLVNVAAKREWPIAETFLRDLGSPETISVVPGNHDAYVGGSVPQMLKSIAPFITSDEGHELPGQSLEPFPYVRIRGQIALIGCSTAVPSAPFMATGTLGRTQRTAIAKCLADMRHRQLFTVVLIHHPPVPGLAIARKRLTDAPELADILAEHGADLVLHGHNHTATRVTTPGPSGPIPVIGVPSASAMPHGHKPAGQYTLFDIAGGPGSWSVHMTRRGIAPSEPLDMQVTEIEVHQLLGAPHHLTDRDNPVTNS